MLHFLHTKGMQTNSWGVNLKCSSTAGSYLCLIKANTEDVLCALQSIIFPHFTCLCDTRQVFLLFRIHISEHLLWMWALMPQEIWKKRGQVQSSTSKTHITGGSVRDLEPSSSLPREQSNKPEKEGLGCGICISSGRKGNPYHLQSDRCLFLQHFKRPARTTFYTSSDLPHMFWNCYLKGLIL